MTAEQLAQVIRDNPGCTVEISTHRWWLYERSTQRTLACAINMEELRDRRHGFGVLLALAEIAGVGVRN